MYVYVGGVFSLFEFSSRFVGIISILRQRFNVKPRFNFLQRFYRDVRFEIIDVIFFFFGNWNLFSGVMLLIIFSSWWYSSIFFSFLEGIQFINTY